MIGADASSLTIEEKHQILTAYIQGGGVQGLLDNENGFDSEDERAIEDEFKLIYDSDSKLREVLGTSADVKKLKIEDKYQILLAYKKGGGV